MKTKYLIIAGLLLTIASGQSWSDTQKGDDFSRALSDSVIPFMVVSELSLLNNGDKGKAEAVQGAKALIATGILTYGLKSAFRVERPNGSALNSFPSGHTSAAFAVATVVADYQPEYKWPAYTLATAIGWSRVENGCHRWNEVIAGAALGYFTAKRYTNQQLTVTPDGVGVSWKF